MEKIFVGPDKKGRIVTILGDTRKTHNSVVLAENSDILVMKAHLIKMKQEWHNYFHSTTHQAAEVPQRRRRQNGCYLLISVRDLEKQL